VQNRATLVYAGKYSAGVLNEGSLVADAIHTRAPGGTGVFRVLLMVRSATPSKGCCSVCTIACDRLRACVAREPAQQTLNRRLCRLVGDRRQRTVQLAQIVRSNSASAVITPSR
jgi:hypothetical protein